MHPVLLERIQGDTATTDPGHRRYLQHDPLSLPPPTITPIATVTAMDTDTDTVTVIATVMDSIQSPRRNLHWKPLRSHMAVAALSAPHKQRKDRVVNTTHVVVLQTDTLNGMADGTIGLVPGQSLDPGRGQDQGLDRPSLRIAEDRLLRRRHRQLLLPAAVIVLHAQFPVDRPDSRNTHALAKYSTLRRAPKEKGTPFYG
jgi:hypothetical protein